jgi:hypothetical protein
MSQYEERDNSGSAFAVQDKRSDTHADLSGKVMVDGKKYWINIWKKQSRNGETYLSISFRERMEASRTEPRREQSPAPRRSDPKDEIPW